jgi:cytochrome c2
VLDPTRWCTRRRRRAERWLSAPTLTAAALLIWGCGGAGDSGADASDAGGQGDQVEATQQAGDLPAAPSGPVDEVLAARGAELFTSRGCVACHTATAERLVGPGLAGVTGRRDFEWIYAMITSPDSMLANDATAKSLLAEYYTPMPDQNVQPDEVMALYEYLRSLGAAESDAE